MQTQINNQSAKIERLEARVSPAIKSLIAKAAELEGSSISDFITKSARKAANRVIHESEVLELTAQESREFIKALLNPPKPNRALRKAYLEYKKAVISR